MACSQGCFADTVKPLLGTLAPRIYDKHRMFFSFLHSWHAETTLHSCVDVGLLRELQTCSVSIFRGVSMFLRPGGKLSGCTTGCSTCNTHAQRKCHHAHECLHAFHTRNVLDAFGRAHVRICTSQYDRIGCSPFAKFATKVAMKLLAKRESCSFSLADSCKDSARSS